MVVEILYSPGISIVRSKLNRNEEDIARVRKCPYITDLSSFSVMLIFNSHDHGHVIFSQSR